MADSTSSMELLKADTEMQLKVRLKAALRWLGCAGFFIILAIFAWVLSTITAVPGDVLTAVSILAVVFLIYALIELDTYRIHRSVANRFFK